MSQARPRLGCCTRGDLVIVRHNCPGQQSFVPHNDSFVKVIDKAVAPPNPTDGGGAVSRASSHRSPERVCGTGSPCGGSRAEACVSKSIGTVFQVCLLALPHYFVGSGGRDKSGSLSCVRARI